LHEKEVDLFKSEGGGGEIEMRVEECFNPYWGGEGPVCKKKFKPYSGLIVWGGCPRKKRGRE